MGVPRDTRSIGDRIKNLEDLVDKLGGDLARVGLDPNGNPVFVADTETGIYRPRLAATTTTPGQSTTITSGTYVEGFTVAGRRQNSTWEIRFTTACDVGTTASIRAVISGTSTELIPPTDVGDGATDAAAWVVALPGAFDDHVSIQIQGLRASGAGNVKIRPTSVAGG